MVSLTKRMTHRMLRLAFSETDQQALHYERYHHPHPRVQQRMEAPVAQESGFTASPDRTTVRHLCQYLRRPISSCITQAVWKR